MTIVTFGLKVKLDIKERMSSPFDDIFFTNGISLEISVLANLEIKPVDIFLGSIRKESTQRANYGGEIFPML